MTTRPTLAGVVIPNQHQQVTTQQEQTQTHSSQPPIFSKPPFTTTIAPPSTSSQYDPQNNWIVDRKRPAPGNQQSSHTEKIRKMANIDDLISDKERKDIPYCLKIQKIRENVVNPMNPRFVTNLKYTLKMQANKFRISDKVKVQNISTGEEFLAKTENLPILKEFSLPETTNVWRIKDRDTQKNTYLARNNQLDSYVNFPYAHLTAFPTPADAIEEVTKASLISENSKFRQELFVKETELQELQIRFERLQMQNSEKEKVTSDDYWRRQYIVSQQVKKTEESNVKEINKVYARKHLEITTANQNLGVENKKLVEKVQQLNSELTKLKKKNRKQKKIIKELSNTEKHEDGDEVVEVVDIMDDGNSPVPSPVILPPEFFE